MTSQKKKLQRIGIKVRRWANSVLPLKISEPQASYTNSSQENLQNVQEDIHQEVATKFSHKNTSAAAPLDIPSLDSEVFYIHPVLFLLRAIFVVIFFFILSAGIIMVIRFSVSENIVDDAIWSILVLVLTGAALFARFFIHWKLNIISVTPQEIKRLCYRSSLNHRFESIPFQYIKFIDVRQKGFFHTIFSCGDIHITSVTTEGFENGMDIVLRDVWHVQDAYDLMEGYITKQNP